MTTIILNPHANSGNGLQKWQKIKTELRNRLGNYTMVRSSAPDEITALISQLLRDGQTTFIAAGGDGTVNLVLNGLMNATTETERRAVTFGAIGLGSSNDFHKPFSPDHTLESVPIRIDSKNTLHHDLGKVRYRDENGRWQNRYFIVNASVGVTAFANHLYNSGDTLIEWLQKRSVSIAILWAALRTIAQYHNIPAAMALNGSSPLTTAVTNLGIIKNPHFASDFCYDTPIAPDSGDFGVNLCEKMNFVEIIKILFHLSHSRFSGSPKTRSWRTSQLHLLTERPIPLETDGEIVMTNEAHFEILHQVLRVCQ